MISILKNYYWTRWLVKHHCKLAPRISSLRKTAVLQLEEYVKLGCVEIHRGNYSFGAHTYMRSGGELFGNIIVGRFCSIGSNVVIGLERNKHPTNWLSTSFFTRSIEDQYESSVLDSTTVIGNDCWIGRDAVIMSGVKIGNGAIVGARALVTSDIPPYAIYAGIPAKLIRYRFPVELIARLIKSSWWDISIAYLEQLKVDKPESCIDNIEKLGNSAIAAYAKIIITRQGAKLLK